MPVYKFKLEDGTEGEYSATDDADATTKYADVVSSIKRNAPPAVAPPQAPKVDPAEFERRRQMQHAADKKLYNPAEGMNWLEKGAVGLHGGVRGAITGAGSLLGLSTPEMEEDRADWDKYKGDLGNWGTAGEFIGEAGITAPIGGPIGKAGQVLTKAIPRLASFAEKGIIPFTKGKYLTRGVSAEAAAQGAATAGVVGTSEHKDLSDRGGDILKGAEGGAVSPLVMKVMSLPITLVKGAAGRLVSMLAPTATALEKRTYDALKRVMGEDGITDAYRAMRDANPVTSTMIPLTSAGLSGSPKLGALERGAESRGLADFPSQRESAARAAWGHMTDIPPKQSSEAGDALRTKFMRNDFVQTPKVYGEGADRIPDVSSQSLRKALGEFGPHLTDVERETFDTLSQALTKRDSAMLGKGRTAIDTGGDADAVSATLALLSAVKGSPTLWKIRSAFNTAASKAADATVKSADEHIMDPDKFMSLVERLHNKLEAGAPLNQTEQLLQRTIEEAAFAASRGNAAHKYNSSKPGRY